MAKLKVHKANKNNYEEMISIDHSIASSHAYRLQTERDGQATTFSFQPVKLPREAHLSYMRDKDSLLKSWDDASQIFMANWMNWRSAMWLLMPAPCLRRPGQRSGGHA
jgi:hypothetical protein